MSCLGLELDSMILWVPSYSAYSRVLWLNQSLGPLHLMETSVSFRKGAEQALRERMHRAAHRLLDPKLAVVVVVYQLRRLVLLTLSHLCLHVKYSVDTDSPLCVHSINYYSLVNKNCGNSKTLRRPLNAELFKNVRKFMRKTEKAYSYICL